MFPQHITNIPDVFLQTSTRCSSRPALQSRVQGRWKILTFADYKEQVLCAAAALLGLDSLPQDRIGILMNNRPEWVISDLAAMMSHGISLPLYPTLQTPQIEYILKESQCKILILEDRQQFEKLMPVLGSLPNLKHIIVVDPIGVDFTNSIHSFHEFLGQGKALLSRQNNFEQRVTQIQPDDIASIVYTSGTTGNPKGVMLTHRNFLSNVKDIMQVADIHSDDTALSFLPLSHVLERTAGHFACSVAIGMRTVYAESVEKVGDNLAEISPTVFIAVPRLFEKIYVKIMNNIQSAPRLRQEIFKWAIAVGEQYQRSLRNRQTSLLLAQKNKLAHALVFKKILAKTGGQIRWLVSGGAPLDPKIAEFFWSIGLPIYEGFGLTETSPVTNVNVPAKNKIGSVGPVLPSVQLKIAEDGEILVKGPSVMKGYYQKPEATQEVFTSDGWFKTGDIGRIDTDGFLWITDRKKEIMITSGGKNIAPQSIENLFKSNHLIGQIMLIGDRRNFVAALIVPNFLALEDWAGKQSISFKSKEDLLENAKVMARYEESLAEVNKNLPRFEQIKKFVLLPEEWTLEGSELTPTLKLRRQIILNKYRTFIDKMYQDSGDGNGFS